MSIFEQLAAPFNPDAISWRVGSTNGDKTKGMALAYIDARDVMDRLDEVLGPDKWQCRYPHANGKTVCEIGVWVPAIADPTGDPWVWKSDGSGDTDFEADKGALSDAFKRAAVRWGIGRYLYALPSPWVAIEQRGRTSIIVKDEEPKLRDFLEKHTETYEWGTPGERVTLKALLNSVRTMLNTADDVRRYREANAGMIGQLRVKPRELINNALDKIAEGSEAKVDQ